MSDRTATTERLLGLDPRSLAAFRVALGALLFVDAIDRFRDVSALYSRGGALPEPLSATGGLRPSLPFVLSGADLAPTWLIVMAVLSVLLAAGWRTRAVTIALWVVNISVQARNPLVLYGSDIVVRMMLWWAMFLPLGQAGSADRRAGREGDPPARVTTFATAAYTLNMGILYFSTYVLKTGRTWHEGTAGWYAVHMDGYTGPLGVAMRSWPGLLMAGTYATLIAEAVGPILLFIPWRTWIFRSIVIVTFLTFHASLELALEIGWFPWVSMTCWIPLFPGEWWDAIGWRLPAGADEIPSPLTRVRDAIVATSFFVIAWWNLATWAPNHVSVSSPFRQAALVLRLDQHWNMYAPNPSQTDGWFQADATLADGSHVDLVTGRRPTTRKPADVPGLYGSLRWNKYMHGIWAGSAERKRYAYLDWWCRTYNATAEVPATEIQLVLVRERSPRPGGVEPAPERVPMESVSCDGKRRTAAPE
ncbi:MAG TPA: HTTM domain-containing protein [Myxococcota bacterium]|nr:HTTM domain-containing protein [Myxococcota bacterium]